MLLIIIKEMHERAKMAIEAEAAHLAVRRKTEEGGEPPVC
jgi:hypothetical protein